MAVSSKSRPAPRRAVTAPVTVARPSGRGRWALVAVAGAVLATTLFGGTHAVWTDAEWATSSANQVGRHNLQVTTDWAGGWHDTAATAGVPDTYFEPGTDVAAGTANVTAPLEVTHYFLPGDTVSQDWFLRNDSGMSARVTLTLADQSPTDGLSQQDLADRATLLGQLRFTITTALWDGAAWTGEQTAAQDATYTDLQAPLTLIAPAAGERDAANAGQAYKVTITVTALPVADDPIGDNRLQGVTLNLMNTFASTAVNG
jgi:hypothetical protein